MIATITKLKRVEQRTNSDCGIACGSILSNIPYGKILYAFKSDTSFTTESCQPVMLQKLLKDHFDFKTKFIKFHSLEKLENHCMLALSPVYQTLHSAHCKNCGFLFGVGSRGHAVVFDVVQKKILDPEFTQLQNLDKHNIQSCLMVI
jgi:hypothetical protein